MPRGVPNSVLGIALLSAAACSQVSVYNGDGDLISETRHGAVFLTTKPGKLPQIVEIKGVGIVSQNGYLTLGYQAANYAILPANDCRIVVWFDKDSKPESLGDLVAEAGNVCFVGPGAHPKGRKE